MIRIFNSICLKMYIYIRESDLTNHFGEVTQLLLHRILIFFLQLLARQTILFMLILDHQKNRDFFEKSNSFKVSPPCTTFSLNSMKSRCHILVIFLVKRSSVCRKKIIFFFRVINFEKDYRLKFMHNFFFQIGLFIIDTFHFIFISMW